MLTYSHTIKHDEHGPLGIDSFTVKSAYKLLVRVYARPYLPTYGPPALSDLAPWVAAQER